MFEAYKMIAFNGAKFGLNYRVAKGENIKLFCFLPNEGKGNGGALKIFGNEFDKSKEFTFPSTNYLYFLNGHDHLVTLYKNYKEVFDSESMKSLYKFQFKNQPTWIFFVPNYLGQTDGILKEYSLITQINNGKIHCGIFEHSNNIILWSTQARILRIVGNTVVGFDELKINRREIKEGNIVWEKSLYELIESSEIGPKKITQILGTAEEFIFVGLGFDLLVALSIESGEVAWAKKMGLGVTRLDIDRKVLHFPNGTLYSFIKIR